MKNLSHKMYNFAVDYLCLLSYEFFNTFDTEHLHVKKKLIGLENSPNMTNEFFITTFTRKSNKILLLKLSYKTRMSNLMHLFVYFFRKGGAKK